MSTSTENSSHADDAELRSIVGRAAGCDQDAWEQLYRRSYSRIFAYARRRLRTDTAADDAVSETMLRALDRIPSFTWQGAGFDAWLYGILRNVVLETFRTDARARTSNDVPERHDDGTDGPLDRLVRADHHAEVRHAFELLSPEDQEVLELRVVAGLSADGVAEATGRAAGAVRMAQSRALQRLRRHYEGVSSGD